MLSYALTDDEAFTLLRKHSQYHKTSKFRDPRRRHGRQFQPPHTAALTIPQKIAASLLDPAANPTPGEWQTDLPGSRK